MRARPKPYSYRDDPAVPDWNDAHGLIVFDGECVLCSNAAKFVVAHDRDSRFRFTTAQGRLGQALFRHYGLDPDDYETNLVIVDGVASTKLASVAAACRRFSWPWKACAALAWIPRWLGDPVYDIAANNRHRWFGRSDACLVPTGELKARFIDDP